MRNIARGSRAAVGARVFNSANIQFTTSVPAALTFDSERYDTDNFHSTSLNSNRLTAPITGLYEIGCCVAWATNGAGTRNMDLRINGVDIVVSHVMAPSGAGGGTNLQVTTVVRMAAGDYVEAICFQSSGGNLNALASPNYSPEMWIALIGTIS